MAIVLTGSAFVLAVHNLERSAMYYRDILGFRDLGVDAPGWCFLQRDDVRIHLGECPSSIAPAALGDHSYFAYVYVADIDSYHTEILARGADVMHAPQDKPWSLREMPVRTVDGHRIMFGQRL
jgi:uncharacterized glyoxalase superfamily protein PhnB